MTNKQIKKLLIIRFGAIGDVVHTTEMFRSIKRAYPEVSIHYVTFPNCANLLINDLDISKIWTISTRNYLGIIRLFFAMRKEKFDAVINLQKGLKVGLLINLLGIKQEARYKGIHDCHAVENFWHIAKELFSEIKISDTLNLYTDNKKNFHLPSDKIIIAFNTGANNDRQGRKWPIKHWIYLAKKLTQEHNCHIVLTGSKDDEAEASKVSQNCHEVTSFCGKLSLSETAALFDKCKLAISGDTGPLHIASATGTTCLALLGSTYPPRVKPYGQKHFTITSELKCSPCNQKECKINPKSKTQECMLSINPEKVLNLILKNNLI